MEQDGVTRDYELASTVDLSTWLERLRARERLVPAGEPVREVDDIGRTVLRYYMVPASGDLERGRVITP